jgi:hypothetical protein
MKDDKKNLGQQQVNVSMDAKATPVLYTDNVFITSNEDGVVLDIGQRVGATAQIQIVARVGMSREQAKKLADALGKNLLIEGASVKTGKKVVN